MLSRCLSLLVLAIMLIMGDMVMRYGNVVALRHGETGQRLYSSASTYTHPKSSEQNLVAAVDFLDSSCYWRILPSSGTVLSEVEGNPIRDADVIRLQHISTEQLLHSHSDYPSPVSDEQEVSGFNEESVADTNDNWILRVLAKQPGETWTTATGARIVHQATANNLFTEAGLSHADHTQGYLEVSATTDDDEDREKLFEWYAEMSDRQCQPGDDIEECRGRLSGTSEEDRERRQSQAETAEKMRNFLQIFRAWDDERFRHLTEDPNNTPKEISIYCPQNPNVNIQELDYALQAEGDCMVLNIQSPHLEAKLALKCNDKKTRERERERQEQEEDREERDRHRDANRQEFPDWEDNEM